MSHCTLREGRLLRSSRSSLSLVPVSLPAREPEPGTEGIKAASFEGEGRGKKRGAPWNTASNRVNCAAYAFISLFRDNLLIVSTKRDNPLVAVCPGRFFGGRHLACLLRTRRSSRAKRINLYAGERAPTLAFSPPGLSALSPGPCNVCTTMATGAGGEQEPRRERSFRNCNENEEVRTKSRIFRGFRGSLERGTDGWEL